MLIILANHRLTFYSIYPSHTDITPTYPSTPPQSPSVVTEHTPTAEHHLPPALTSSSPADLRAKVDFGQTLSPSHPSDYPPQVTGPLSVAASSISRPQPQHFPSDKEPRVRGGPKPVLDETSQPLTFSNLTSTVLPGSMGCR